LPRKKLRSKRPRQNSKWMKSFELKTKSGNGKRNLKQIERKLPRNKSGMKKKPVKRLKRSRVVGLKVR
jgi:hypothetical protein